MARSMLPAPARGRRGSLGLIHMWPQRRRRPTRAETSEKSAPCWATTKPSPMDQMPDRTYDGLVSQEGREEGQEPWGSHGALCVSSHICGQGDFSAARRNGESREQSLCRNSQATPRAADGLGRLAQAGPG